MANFPGSNDIVELNGLFKKVYADKLENIIPDGKKVVNLIKFLPKNKATGADYNQAIILGLEHG
jgi:hypothetical protein